MKNKLWIPVITLLLLTSIDGYGQRWKLRRYEMDMYLSGVSMHGDIGEANKPLANMFNGFRPSIGVTPRFMIAEHVAVAMDLGYYMYGGKDREGSSHGRVFSFNSHAFVHGIRGEYYVFGSGRSILSGAVYNRRGMINNYNKLYVYIFGGASGVLSKSTVRYVESGEEIPEDTPAYYNNPVYSLVFPVGAGLKFSIDPRWSLGVEAGYAFSLSDKLDGYQSDYSQYNDTYYTLSVRAIYKIRNDKHGRPVFKKLYR